MPFLLKYKYYLLAILVPLLVFMLRKFFRFRKKRKDQAELSQQQRRNEALTQALRNPMANTPSKPPANIPLEVSWDEKSAKKPKVNAEALMIELIELTDYSERKYIFRADQTIRIGSGRGNQLVSYRDGVAPQHCVIRTVRNQPCVFSMPGTQTLLRRGKKRANVTEDGVYLNNGDLLELGRSQIKFRMFRS